MRNRLLAALLPWLMVPGFGQAEILQPFTEEIRQIVSDWEAEDWDDGEIKLHPDAYTWQSDIHLTLRAAEPLAGRSAMDVARLHFDGFELDDNSLDPTIVDMSGADVDSPGIIRKSYGWTYGFDQNFSSFGVIERDDGTALPYRYNCQIDEEDYGEEQCLKAVTMIIYGLRGIENFSLAMPEPTAPLSVPFWSAEYDASGSTILSSRNFYGTVTATVIVTAPMDMQPDERRAGIEAFSGNLVDDFDDQPDEHPGFVEWVGSQNDPWIRRTFPEAFSGPSTVMAGTQATPDGKTVLIGVRCPNEGWQGSCAHAVAMAQQQTASGQAEARRMRIVSETWDTLPDNGLKNEDVAAVYLVGEGSSATGIYTMVFNAVLLLKDGRACRCFDRALGMIVPSESETEDAEIWGRWVDQNGSINLVWRDGGIETLAVSGATAMTGGNATTRFEGSFTHTSSGGNVIMGTSYLSQSFFEFGRDGTFSSDRSSAFSVTVGNTVSPDAYVAGGSSGSGPRGTYEIDGYNMKLTYPDGRIQWMGFAQPADEAASPVKSQLWLDGTWYYNDDD